MPLINPACATVRQLALYGLIAHMNGELDLANEIASEAYLYEQIPLVDPPLAERAHSSQMYVVSMALQTAQAMAVSAMTGNKEGLKRLMEVRDSYETEWSRF